MKKKEAQKLKLKLKKKLQKEKTKNNKLNVFVEGKAKEFKIIDKEKLRNKKMKKMGIEKIEKRILNELYKYNCGIREYVLSELSRIIIKIKNNQYGSILPTAKLLVEIALNQEKIKKDYIEINELQDYQMEVLNTTERQVLKTEMFSVIVDFKINEDLDYGAIKVVFEMVHLAIVKKLEERKICEFREFVDRNDEIVSIEVEYSLDNEKYDLLRSGMEPYCFWEDTNEYSKYDIKYYESFIKESDVNLDNKDEEILEEYQEIEEIEEVKESENVQESENIQESQDDNNIEQSERLYVIDLIKKSIDICNKNIDKTISSEELMEDEYFGEIYEEIINISKDENWLLNYKNNEIDNITDKLNDVERSLIFMEFDALYFRSITLPQINNYHWKIIKTGFTILLYQIINGVSNKEVNKMKIKIREDGSIIDIIISYGRPLTRKGKFDPEKICEKMFFYKQWAGALYSNENKLIRETTNFMEICEKLNLSLKIDGLEEITMIEEDDIYDSYNYVELLEKSIELKRAGYFEEAKKVLIKAIKIDQTMPTAYYNLGKLLYILEDFDSSINSYIAAYKRDIIGFMKNTPIGVYNFYVNLGHSLFDQEYLYGSKYSDVIKEYKMGVKGKLQRANKVSFLQDEYEKLIAKKASDYLQELN